MRSRNYNDPVELFGMGFDFNKESPFLGSVNVFGAGSFPPAPGYFLLLDGTPFLLLDGTNFTLL